MSTTEIPETSTPPVARKISLAWRLAPLLILTAGALTWLGWQFWILQKEAAHFRAYDFRLVQLSGEIGRLDEVLTMSARMAAATLDPKWEARYKENDPKLDDIINETSTLDPQVMGDFVAETDEANHKLEVMEEKAFDLIHKKEGAAAAALLSGTDYTQQKQIYADGMAKLNTTVLANAHSALDRQSQRVEIAIVTLAGLVVAFFIFWVAILRAGSHKPAATK